MLVADGLLRTAGLKSFYEYWDSLPKTAFMPDRQDFNPAAIYKLMPNVTILEVISSEFIRARLIGTAVAATLGVDMTDHNYLDYIVEDERANYLKMLGQQLSQPCGRRSVMRARRSTGMVGHVEVISLPMFYARSGNPMLLSCFEAMESMGFDDVEIRQVQGFDFVEWIDIGAGVPPKR